VVIFLLIIFQGYKDLPEEENLRNIQFQTVLPSCGDAGSHVPKLL